MKKLLFICFTYIVSSSICLSKTIRQINIVGNARIEAEAILFEIPYKKGAPYEDNTANEILKALNRTGYFEDIKVNIHNDIIIIEVKENPIINKIAYEGMKHAIRETLRDLIKLKPRQILSKANVQETQQLILEVYRRQGYLSAQVTPKIVRVQQQGVPLSQANAVDVVFEIKEGNVAYVRKINFIGNHSFPATDLKDMLETHEKSWFHLSFLGGTVNKVYDPDRFIEDQQNLMRFYMNQGYADFDIISASAELSTNKENFFLTFYIHEGDKYKFGDITVESKIKKLDGKILENGIMAKKGQIFSKQMIDICEEILKSLAKIRGYNFAVIDPVFKKNKSTKTIDVKFIVREGPKIFIERIDIKGNHHTRDNIIRREIGFDEGDAFYAKQLKTAETRVKDLDFFKTVKTDVKEGSKPDSAIVTVEVEEQRTGEVFFQGGYSSLERFSIQGHLREPNFRGKGQTATLDVSYSKREFECSVDFSEPQLFRRPLFGEFSLFHTRSKKLIGTIQSETGGFVRTGYHLTPRIIQNWTYQLHRENIKADTELLEEIQKKKKTDSTNNWEEFLKSDAGKEHLKFINTDEEYGVYWGSSITHSLAYDRRNRRMLPSKGYLLSWKTTFSGLGGNIYYLKNTFSADWHHRLYKEIILTLRSNFSHVTGIGDNKLRTVNALYLGGESLRGFDIQGISPVRGLPKEKFTQTFNEFVKAKKDYIAAEDQKFLEDKQDMILQYLLNESKLEHQDIKKFFQIYESAADNQQTNILQLNDLIKVRGKKVGATLAWYGSVELAFPMPFFPRDSEIFGTIFSDFGSAWRSNRKQEKGDILLDDHKIRLSLGSSIAWNSPFGLISVGYAWPIIKEKYDIPQKFLFGYGMRFS